MANQRVVERQAQVVSRAQEFIPQLPILNIQQQQPSRIPIQINPPFGGPAGVGVTFGGTQQVAPSLDVASQVSGLPMLGPFGIAPTVVSRAVRMCPTGHRLARDGLCYPKALLAKRSKLRMWPAEPAPPITRSDARALRKHESVEKKLKRLGKQAGLKVTG